jgi:phosphohistidine phosphatase
MKLFFLRHGLAGDQSEWKGDDAQRPLTSEGKEKMKLSASALKELKLGVEMIITSPLTRARQTAEIVAKKLNCKLTEETRLSPGFNIDDLRDILLDHPNTETIMFVGHEPDFSETVSALIGGGDIELKKGGLALVDLPNARSNHGELLWLLPPRLLAR